MNLKVGLEIDGLGVGLEERLEGGWKGDGERWKKRNERFVLPLLLLLVEIPNLSELSIVDPRVLEGVSLS